MRQENELGAKALVYLEMRLCKMSEGFDPKDHLFRCLFWFTDFLIGDGADELGVFDEATAPPEGSQRAVVGGTVGIVDGS